jgi:hypothetical protein
LFTGGFSFGAAAPVALPTPSGGFTIGAANPAPTPDALLAKAEAKADGETKAGSPAPSGAPKTSSTLLTAKAYLTALELESDQEEKVGNEMQTAQDAWSRVMSFSCASALDVSMPAGFGEGTEEEEESELSRLVTALDTMYCPELRERAGSGKQPDESAFVVQRSSMCEGEGEGEGEGGLSVDEDGDRAAAGGSNS